MMSDLISYEKALMIMKAVARESEATYPTERLPLLKCVGRFVAEPVHASENLPALPISAMDGFAVQSCHFSEASNSHPIDVSVVGLRFAGDDAPMPCSQNPAAIEIMTGATLSNPDWDAVIRLEDVHVIEFENKKLIRVCRPVKKSENIRPIGSDVIFGNEILKRHSLVTPEAVMTCAALGTEFLQVFRKPKVVLVSTGNELVSFQNSCLSQGRVRNSSAPYIEAAAQTMGFELIDSIDVPDSPEQFEKVIAELTSQDIDVILTTGGVSVGKADFVERSLVKLGHSINFHKVAIRPGKPILFSQCLSKSKKVIFGLPGNPIATAVGLRFFMLPYLRTLMGLEDEPHIRIRLRNNCQKPSELTCFFHGHIQADATSLQFTTSPHQASYMVGPLASANGWAILPDGHDTSSAGDIVEVVPFLPLCPNQTRSHL